MKKAVFIDKDGTLIKDIPYNVERDLVVLNEYAGEALSILKENNFLIIIISNQSGIALGFFEEDDLNEIYTEIQQQLWCDRVLIDGFYYCPHLPGGAIEKYAVDCDCRKPKPGLILKAAQEHNIDIGNSWMIGDILNDVEAGNAAGCQTILLDNGNETEWKLSKERDPRYIVQNLLQAVKIIIREDVIKEETYDKRLAQM